MRVAIEWFCWICFSSSNEGSMEWVSLLIQHWASKAFRLCFNIRAIAGSYCECDRFAIAPVSCLFCGCG